MAVKFQNVALDCWEHFIVENIRRNDNETGVYREKVIVTDPDKVRVFYPHNLIKIDESDCKPSHKKFYLMRRLELDLQAP